MKKLFILLVVTLFFSSCLIENTKIHLLNKKGKNTIILEENNSKIYLKTRLKETFDKDNYNSDYVNVSVNINEFNSLKIKKFSINIWEKPNDIYEKVIKGKISYDEEMLMMNKSEDINNEVTNVIFSPQTYPINTVFYIQTEKSERTFNSKEFIIETNMLIELNNEEYSINKKDTLFRKVEKKHQFRVH